MGKPDYPPAAFTPTMLGYTGQGAFRYWCQTALPLVYDDSLSYYELLNKVVVYLNNVISDMTNATTNIDSLLSAFNQLQEYVNTYFVDIDIQDEINQKLDELALDGTLTDLISPFIPDLVTEWLNEHVTPTTPIVDSSLTISGAAADAKITGDKIKALETTYSKRLNVTDFVWQNGNLAYSPTTGAYRSGTSDTRLTFTERVEYDPGTTVNIVPGTNCMYRIGFFSNTGDIIVNPARTYYPIDTGEQGTWFTEEKTFDPPETAISYVLILAYADENPISPANKPDITVNYIGKIATIETEVNDISPKINEIYPSFTEVSDINNVASSWQMYNIVGNNERVSLNAASNRLCFKSRYELPDNTILDIVPGDTTKYRVIFFDYRGTLEPEIVYTVVMGDYDDISYWHTDARKMLVPDGAVSFAVVVADYYDNVISTGNRPEITINIVGVVNNLESATDYKGIYSRVGQGFYKPQYHWTEGMVNVSGASVAISNNRFCTQASPVFSGIDNENKIIIVDCAGYDTRCTFWNSETMASANLIDTNSNRNWTHDFATIPVPVDAKMYRVSIRKPDNSVMSIGDTFKVSIIEGNGFRKNYNKWKKKTISILGDSITTFAGSGSTAADGHLIADGTYTYAGNHCRYPASQIKHVTETYWYKTIQSLDLELLVNDSWAGSLLTNYEAGTDSGSDIYGCSMTRINHLGEKGNPDIILVGLGTNDTHFSAPMGVFDKTNPKSMTPTEIQAMDDTTFYNALKALFCRLQSVYTSAKIIYMLPSYTTSYYGADKLDEYCNAIIEVCEYFGVSYIDTRKIDMTLFNTGSYLQDGIHPNVAGMDMYYRKLSTEILNVIE